ncbi:MAG: ribosomal protein S18-alanine N-acetyltransferase [Lachnospiraceae bacterium]|nr:ribosomal protein S18-alanine N-acetyltransferase [Lachnospiraceae bacterium]
MIEITELTEEYLDAVTLLDAAVFPDSPWGRDSFKNNIINDYDYPVVALTDGNVVGYGIIRQIDAGEILLIGVSPEERRKGIGRMITNELLSWANRGENIFLEVREGNTAARKLYESAGFTEIARRRNYYRDPVEDAIIMMC